MHDASPGPRTNLQRKVLKDTTINDRQGEKSRTTSPGRLSRSRRPGQVQGGPKKRGKVRSTALNRPAQVAKETSVKKSRGAPTDRLHESPGGGRAQR